MEISPTAAMPLLGAACLASVATIRPPVAANGCPAASDEPLTLSLARSIVPSGAVQAQPARGRTPRSSHAASVASTVRGERLVDLEEVEVLQRQPVAGQQPGHGERGGHQQPVLRRAQSPRPRPRRRPRAPARAGRARRPIPRWPAAPPRRRRSAAWSCRPSWSPRCPGLPKTGLSLASFSSVVSAAGWSRGSARGTG